MNLRVLPTAILIGFAAISAVQAAEVKKSISITGDPAKIWKIANEFCSIPDWDPVFSACTQHMENGVVWRVLTIAQGGAKVREKLTDVDDTSYSYSITEAPLPISNHMGKLWIEPGMNGKANTVRWEVSFDVKGDAKVTADTVEAIGGILDTGLAKIKEIAENNG